jgi:hypothetical protein
MATGTAFTNYLENELLDHLLGKAARDFTSPAVLALALHSADPTETGGASELANSDGYSRQAISFDAASGGSAASSNAQAFTASGGDWSAATHFTITDNLTWGAGNVLIYGQLDASRTVTDGDTLNFDAGDVTVSLD